MFDVITSERSTAPVESPGRQEARGRGWGGSDRTRAPRGGTGACMWLWVSALASGRAPSTRPGREWLG
jgi:hypothetical protein